MGSISCKQLSRCYIVAEDKAALKTDIRPDKLKKVKSVEGLKVEDSEEKRQTLTGRH